MQSIKSNELLQGECLRTVQYNKKFGSDYFPEISDSMGGHKHMKT